MMRPCLACGEPTSATRCDDCAPPVPIDHALSATRRGYDSRWQRLSLRARRLQPYCSDCGTSSDLTGDHLVWPARSLDDIDVVCRRCNSKRGPIRGQGGRGDDLAPGPASLGRQPVTVENDSQQAGGGGR